MADPGIDDSVDEIDDQVDQDDDSGDQQNAALQRRIVAPTDRIDQPMADTWPGEDRLRQHRARHQTRNRQANHRHHGQKRIAQRVNADDARGRQPLGARRPHVIFAQDFEFVKGAVDPATGLPTSENVSIDAQFNLVEIATNKSVMTGTTFSRVTYDMPGSYQRYARSRAFRDAEDRAAQEIADNIQTRLASFFTAGT